MSKWKNIQMTKREKALLTILIAEVRGCKNMQEVQAVTDSWVKANDLHPEEVETLTEEEMWVSLSRTEGRVGQKGLRDPEAPCERYDSHPEGPLDSADCKGDGHYLCWQCDYHKT